MKSKDTKDGGIFYSDIVEMHSRAKRALSKAKTIENFQQKIPARINAKTIIMVNVGADINRAVFEFKKRHKL
jgi:hypothetical protein